MLGSYQNWFEAALYQLWKSALMQMIIHGVFRYNALFQGRVHPVDQVYPMEHAYAFALFASCLVVVSFISNRIQQWNNTRKKKTLCRYP